MRIGIIGAMESEIKLIKENMVVVNIKQKAQMDYHIGNYRGKEIVLVKSGIGKVNAAICSQILIDEFGVESIANVGVAGGVMKNLDFGDVVIANDLIQHDVDGTVCGHKIGQVPRLDTLSFRCDDWLLDCAYIGTKEIDEFNVVKGRIITGDQIISSTSKLNSFRELFNPCAVEMESAAIGHTCYLNRIPFIIIRGISDKADEDMNNVYSDYEDVAIRNATLVFNNMLDNMQVKKDEN